jgi:hypothetical protein
MKQFIAIILAVSYLCLSVGITVHTHYCMGKLVGASFIEPDDNHQCSHCGMTKKTSKKGCCKDEHKTFKNDSDQLLFKASITKYQLCEYTLPLKLSIFLSRIKILIYYSDRMAQAHAPPLIVSVLPIYILVRNLRV